MAKKTYRVDFTRILKNGKEIPTSYDVEVEDKVSDKGNKNKGKDRAKKVVIDTFPKDDIRFTGTVEDEKEIIKEGNGKEGNK